MEKRFIFELYSNKELVSQFTDNMASSSQLREEIKKIEDEGLKTRISEKEVTQDFYQEIVDEGGYIKYNLK